MKHLKKTVIVVALVLTAAPAAAQSDADVAAREAERAKLAHELDAREAEVQKRLEEAEARMAAAARQIAELTSERLPKIRGVQSRFEFINDGRPRLGVTIGGDTDGPVEGARVIGVTPGSAASEAGLRAGDIITAVNDEALSAGSAEEANDRLVDFMDGVEAGDTLSIEYLRDGKVGQVEVEPQAVDVNVFAFGGPMRVPDAPHVPGLQVIPEIAGDLKNRFMLSWTSAGWGDMELVELNEGLGSYFGTDQGLLVVRAPAAGFLKLEDGDVIQQIDGREPTSVRHAMRILGSYEPGEKLELSIMRDKKRRTLDVEIPAELSGSLDRPVPLAPVPAMAPVPAIQALPPERT